MEELSIQNLSNQPVFVQAGDIVKGGQQDRVLTTDLLLPPHSGKVPIAAFCVEQGRWTRRGTEPAGHFHAAAASVPTRALKMAVREPGSQTKVWSEVAMALVNLGSAGVVSAGVSAVRALSTPGETSMQLGLEDRRVTQAVDQYVSALTKISDGKADAVGYVYAVNGKFSGADVYGSADLFQRMWPKLLRSSATEAFAEPSKVKAATPLTAAAIQQALLAGDQGRAAAPRSNGSVSVTKKESEKAVLYETADRKSGGTLLHKSYIAK